MNKKGKVRKSKVAHLKICSWEYLLCNNESYIYKNMFLSSSGNYERSRDFFC